MCGWLPILAAVAVLAGLPVAGLDGARPAAAEEADGLARDLRVAARHDLPVARRLDAAARILANPGVDDAAALARAALGLLPYAPETAGWLLVRAADAGWIPDALRDRMRAALEARLQDDALGPHDRARLVAVGLLVGRRPPEAAAELTRLWPAPDLVGAVLRRELVVPEGTEGLPAQAEVARSALEEQREIAALLDRATRDEPEAMQAGLDGLVARGAEAVPLLLHEARLAAAGGAPGRTARAARAIVALGFLGDRRATPVLAEALAAPSGWVRVAAATALGDLGDPAGAPPLAAHITNTGDLFRARDQWAYPGASGTNVPADAWQGIDYFAVDVAAADALLRLGAKNAAGYLLAKQLDPTVKNARIRVYQDAIDALRRAFAHTEAKPLVTAYNVDAGLPQRNAAFLALARWWHHHRDDEDVLAVTLDEDDEGFRRGVDVLADKLHDTDVRQFMIVKPALELLGHAATPTVVASLARATRGSAKTELARTLAMLRDPRAIPALVGLLEDKLPFVRAAGAEALGPYVHAHPEALAAARRMLADPDPGARVSALKALVSAPPDPALVAAVARAHPQEPSSDWQRAETVFLLVQEGEAHWPAVAAGLEHRDRHVREAWWRLLRAALDLPAHAHDPHPAPDLPARRRLTRAEALAALAARRSR